MQFLKTNPKKSIPDKQKTDNKGNKSKKSIPDKPLKHPKKSISPTSPYEVIMPNGQTNTVQPEQHPAGLFENLFKPQVVLPGTPNHPDFKPIILDDTREIMTTGDSKSIPKKTLGAATIKAQQELSEKYGIPTFDLQGELSTIPTTRPASGINVGTGIYGSSVSDFNEFVKQLSPSKAKVPTGPVVLPGGTVIDVPFSSKLVQGENPLGSRDIPPSLSSTIQKYTPYLVIAGIGIAALMVIKK